MALLDLLGGALKLLGPHNGPVLPHAPVPSSPDTTARLPDNQPGDGGRLNRKQEGSGRQTSEALGN